MLKFLKKLLGISEVQTYELPNWDKPNFAMTRTGKGVSFESGLTVNGLCVNDFCYLLQHYSNRKVNNFDNLNMISELKDEIIANIDADLNSERLPEENITSRNNAIANLENLKMIIETLAHLKVESRLL